MKKANKKAISIIIADIEKSRVGLEKLIELNKEDFSFSPDFSVELAEIHLSDAMIKLKNATI